VQAACLLSGTEDKSVLRPFSDRSSLWGLAYFSAALGSCVSAPLPSEILEDDFTDKSVNVLKMTFKTSNDIVSPVATLGWERGPGEGHTIIKPFFRMQ
jgi:hypothetical protein